VSNNMIFNPQRVIESFTERLNSHGLHWFRHRLCDFLQNYVDDALPSPYGTLSRSSCFIEIADAIALLNNDSENQPV
jgi:hypothetical protein